MMIMIMMIMKNLCSDKMILEMIKRDASGTLHWDGGEHVDDDSNEPVAVMEMVLEMMKKRRGVSIWNSPL